MIQSLFEIVLGILVDAVFRFVLLPLFLILATPIILVRALFGPERYAANVRSGYRRVLAYWAEHVLG
jgi:hypothetical protein